MTNNTQASQQVPSDKTVLTDEQIDKICAGFSTWMFPVETQNRDCERAIARAIERAVLAAATPGQVEDRRDAERYRWLRSKDREDWNNAIFVTGDGHQDYYAANCLSGDALDAAIDAARAVALKSASVSEQKGNV